MILTALIPKNLQQMQKMHQDMMQNKNLINHIKPEYKEVDILLKKNSIEFASMSTDGNIELAYSMKHETKLFKIKYTEEDWEELEAILNED